MGSHFMLNIMRRRQLVMLCVCFISPTNCMEFLIDPPNPNSSDLVPPESMDNGFLLNGYPPSESTKLADDPEPLKNASNQRCGDKPVWDDYIKIVCVPLFTVFGLVGNTLSFIVMFSPIYNRKSYSYYLRALAVSDNLILIITCVASANDVTFQLTGTRLLDNHNSFTCKTSEFLSNVIALVSSWLIVCFTIDRYIAVCHPLQRARLCTQSSAIKSIIIVVLVAMASQVYLFIFIDHVEGRSKSQQCHAPPELRIQYFSLDYYWFSFTLRFMAPFLVIAICNGLIIFHIKRTRQRRGSFDYDKRVRSNTMAICTLYVVCAVYIACLCPNAIVSTILITEFLILKSSDLYCKLLVFNTPFQMIRLINYSVNFILYGLSGRQFRNEVGRLLRCKMHVHMRAHNCNIQEQARAKLYPHGLRSPVMNVKHCMEANKTPSEDEMPMRNISK